MRANASTDAERSRRRPDRCCGFRCRWDRAGASGARRVRTVDNRRPWFIPPLRRLDPALPSPDHQSRLSPPSPPHGCPRAGPGRAQVHPQRGVGQTRCFTEGGFRESAQSATAAAARRGLPHWGGHAGTLPWRAGAQTSRPRLASSSTSRTRSASLNHAARLPAGSRVTRRTSSRLSATARRWLITTTIRPLAAWSCSASRASVSALASSEPKPSSRNNESSRPPSRPASSTRPRASARLARKVSPPESVFVLRGSPATRSMIWKSSAKA